MSVQPTVLIADDHRILASGVTALLERANRYKVIGVAATGQEALQRTRSLRPDVVILDLTMPGGSGLAVLTRIAALSKVLIMTMHDDTAYVRQAMQQGASGYILKEASDAELLHAIDAVAGGGLYLYPSLAVDLLPVSRSKQAATEGRLSRREMQVLKLLSLGHLNHEIAEQLGVSVRTVETYRARLSAKLGLASRADLVSFALEHGLI